MQEVLKKIKKWSGENALVLLYFVFAVLVEMTAVFVVEGTPFMTRPFLSLGLLLFVCGIVLLVKSNKGRAITCTVMLLLQAVLDLVFSVIYDMTDQYFDLGMFNLRNDAFAILENIPVNFVTFYSGLFFGLMYLVFSLRFAYRHERASAGTKSLFFYVALAAAGIATLGVAFFAYFPRESKNKYDEMIEGKTGSAYSSYGMIGNVLGEFGKAIFQDTTPIDGKDIDDFIYAKASSAEEPYFGVLKDKNVVMVLAESLEWYVFLRSQTEGDLHGEFPNALPITQEDLAAIYPNLTEYYNESVVLTNFHGREKTDTAETLSIVGSYPTGAYVNYEYEENTLPYTIPNIIKMQTGGEASLRSFHNGYKTFYNRVQAHQSFGFESLTDMYDMEAMSNAIEKEGGEEIFYNYMDNMDKKERNLDSEMVETAKDLMFPTDRRFYSYLTTITMHGMYYDRENLRKENNVKLETQLSLLEKYEPIDKAAENYEYDYNLYNYMKTAVEFDYMLGCMKADLQKKGLWENTVIVLFGDHNAYYQEMSNYVKNIFDYKEGVKFTDLYNVPLMIRNSALTEEVAKRGDARIIDKFTCTADIAPTLMSLLGIRYFENMYYGHSVFSDTVSVLYSRAYGIFLGDGILRRSVTGKLYLHDGLTEDGHNVSDTVAAFEREGKILVEKIKYCDYIFRQDHFGEQEYYERFQTEMKRLNGWT